MFVKVTTPSTNLETNVSFNVKIPIIPERNDGNYNNKRLDSKGFTGTISVWGQLCNSRTKPSPWICFQSLSKLNFLSTNSQLTTLMYILPNWLSFQVRATHFAETECSQQLHCWNWFNSPKLTLQITIHVFSNSHKKDPCFSTKAWITFSGCL